MEFRLAVNPEVSTLEPMGEKEGRFAIANFESGGRPVGASHIFAAYATTVACPWEEPFVLNDQHIEQYLGLDKRKDLTKLEKLTLIKDLVHQCCQIMVSLHWPRQGRVQSFSLEEHPVWHLLNTKYYFETDTAGDRHLIGLEFTVRAGTWSRQFLNQRDYRRFIAFYQYGTLPQSLLNRGNEQLAAARRGSAAVAVAAVQTAVGGATSGVTIRTLLRVAYGEAKVHEATTVRGCP